MYSGGDLVVNMKHSLMPVVDTLTQQQEHSAD